MKRKIKLKQLENRLKKIETKVYGMPLCDNCLDKKQKFQTGETILGNIAGFCSKKCEKHYQLKSL